MIDLGIAIHIQQAVAFPMQVGEFGDDIALDAVMTADLFDLIFERIELQMLAGFGERVQRRKHMIKVIILKTLLHAAWVHHALPPFQPRIEPPWGAATISLIELCYFWQSPVAKLGD